MVGKLKGLADAFDPVRDIHVKQCSGNGLKGKSLHFVGHIYAGSITPVLGVLDSEAGYVVADFLYIAGGETQAASFVGDASAAALPRSPVRHPSGTAWPLHCASAPKSGG